MSWAKTEPAALGSGIWMGEKQGGWDHPIIINKKAEEEEDTFNDLFFPLLFLGDASLRSCAPKASEGVGRA